MPAGQLTALAVREFVAVGAGRHLPRPPLRVVSLDKLLLLLDGGLEADIRPCGRPEQDRVFRQGERLHGGRPWLADDNLGECDARQGALRPSATWTGSPLRSSCTTGEAGEREFFRATQAVGLNRALELAWTVADTAEVASG